nr:oxysterol-binding protein like 4 [Quercus suber]
MTVFEVWSSLGSRLGMRVGRHVKNSLTAKSIATINGDLSNITAPPFVLADKSTTEFPRYWIEHPDLFVAPAQEKDPARRCLAVLKWFLASLKSQQYAGRDPSEGIKKPLNAFLGEVFVGECGSETEGVTRLVSEQVSHHPPVTACYLWNEKHAVHAEGYTRQEITFSGSVNIQQIGYAVLTVGKYDENYLIPLPNIKVKGILTGSPYPELDGSYSIVSSAGYIAEVDFTGKGMLGLSGQKNKVHAAIYHGDHTDRGKAVYSAEGTWSDTFVFKDSNGNEIDSYDVSSAPATTFNVPSTETQDAWESRKAWHGVIEGVQTGNMQQVADSKNTLESAQRELRKNTETSDANWSALFFRKEKAHPVAEKLLSTIGKPLDPDSTCGVWRFDADRAASTKRPWRGYRRRSRRQSLRGGGMIERFEHLKSKEPLNEQQRNRSVARFPVHVDDLYNPDLRRRLYGIRGYRHLGRACFRREVGSILARSTCRCQPFRFRDREMVNSRSGDRFRRISFHITTALCNAVCSIASYAHMPPPIGTSMLRLRLVLLHFRKRLGCNAW